MYEHYVTGNNKEIIIIIIIIIIIAAQNYYKNWRHDKVAQVVQWNLCKKFGYNATELGI